MISSISFPQFQDSSILCRELPKVLIKPKVIRLDVDTNKLVSFFENSPPKFFEKSSPKSDSSDLVQFNQIEKSYQVRIGVTNSAFTRMTPKTSIDQESFWAIDKLSELDSPKECEVEKIELKYTKREKPPTQLHFNNPTPSFSTRWDVIYKTLLRDCRKYFTECFQMKSMRKAKKLSKLAAILDRFVEETFTKHSKWVRREILFYLGCLVYPKEMISSRVGLYDEEGRILKGKERANKVKRIKELHNFLYNFSMEKWEKFFENPYLCIVFQAYISGDPKRIETNSTMNKNRLVYRGAIDLIDRKIESSLKKSNSF